MDFDPYPEEDSGCVVAILAFVMLLSAVALIALAFKFLFS